jgi:hypothetical protein
MIDQEIKAVTVYFLGIQFNNNLKVEVHNLQLYTLQYRKNVDFKESLLGLQWIFEWMNNTGVPLLYWQL